MKNIVVIGAGTMGNGIAHTFAQTGFKVNLVDVSQQALDKGILSLDGGAVMYNEIVLGYDIDSSAIKLFSEDQAKTREAIKLQLKELSKGKTASKPEE